LLLVKLASVFLGLSGTGGSCFLLAILFISLTQYKHYYIFHRDDPGKLCKPFDPFLTKENRDAIMFASLYKENPMDRFINI
jgi:hypothetical protein